MSDDEREVRDFLQSEANHAPQPTRINPATVRRAQLKRAGFLTTAFLGVGIVVGSIGLVAINISKDQSTIDRGPTSEALDPRVTATVEVGRNPQALEVGAGYVWVTVYNRSAPEGF